MINRRFLTKVLAAVLAACMLTTPVTVFAEGEPEVNTSEDNTSGDDAAGDNEEDTSDENNGDGDEDSRPAAEVTADKEDVKEDFGDLSAKGENASAIEIYAEEGHKAEVTTGSLKSEEYTGVSASSFTEGEADLTVNGSIESAGIGVYAGTDATGVVRTEVNGDVISETYDGIEADAGFVDDPYDPSAGDSKPNIEIKVNGNVTGGEDGVYASAVGGTTVSASVNGDSTGEVEGINVYCNTGGTANVTVLGNVSGEEDGIRAILFENGKTDISVNGNATGGDFGIDTVVGAGSKGNIAVNGNASGKYGGINSYAENGGVINISVKGDVQSDEEAIWLMSFDEGSANNVIVGGDVRSATTGVRLDSYDKSAQNVVIEGTIYAGNAAVAVDGTGRNSVTVWRIETDGMTAGIYKQDESGMSVPYEDEETAKQIRYIIRVNQTEGADLRATDADGNPLATVTGLNGKALEYAYEGDKVLLKVDVNDRYRLDAAYGDDGQKLELVKDDNGNYYINVPRNGGVSFSVRLTYVGKDDKDDKDKDDKKPDAQTAAIYTLTDSAAVFLVSSAPAGSPVTLSNLTGTGLSAALVQSLLARRDIPVALTFMINGVTYRIIIPAGADIASLTGADGSISFASLGQAFGMASV